MASKIAKPDVADVQQQVAALQRMKRFEQNRMAQQNAAETKGGIKNATADLKSVSQTNLKTNQSNKSFKSGSKVLTKFDAESGSCVTFNTDTSSMLHNPSSLNTYASSKMEMQLNFLAKQLELEKLRREKL